MDFQEPRTAAEKYVQGALEELRGEWISMKRVIELARNLADSDGMSPSRAACLAYLDKRAQDNMLEQREVYSNLGRLVRLP